MQEEKLTTDELPPALQQAIHRAETFVGSQTGKRIPKVTVALDRDAERNKHAVAYYRPSRRTIFFGRTLTDAGKILSVDNERDKAQPLQTGAGIDIEALEMTCAEELCHAVFHEAGLDAAAHEIAIHYLRHETFNAQRDEFELYLSKLVTPKELARLLSRDGPLLYKVFSRWPKAKLALLATAVFGNRLLKQDGARPHKSS
jgi:hypothetical protein